MIPNWVEDVEKWQDAPEPRRARVHLGGKKFAFGFVVPEGETAIVSDRGLVISHIERADISIVGESRK